MPNTDPSIISSPRNQRPVATDPGKVHLAGSAKLRCVGALLGVGCVAILLAAWHIEPSCLPFGPETQLSMPSCGLQARTGYPCPTCGMTRAWAQAVRGNFVGAFQANIAGAILAVGCGLGVLGGLGTAIGGRGFHGRFVKPLTSSLRPEQWFYALLGLVLLAWAWNGLWAFVTQQQ